MADESPMKKSIYGSWDEDTVNTFKKWQRRTILQVLEQTHESGDLDRYVVADDDLHKQIIQLGGNSLVDDLYYRVRSMNQQFRIRSLSSHNRFQDSVAEHQDLIIEEAYDIL